MKTIKNADERKNQILDAADALFKTKGFDGTAVTDIMERVGIAKGTLYYHFKSKEDIMNALIDRYSVELLTSAREVAKDKSIPVVQRIFETIMAMNIRDGEEITTHMHKPQNALMHQKTQQAMLEGVPPILTEIVEDGIRENLFNTPYPYETVEMLVAHVNTVFNDYTANFGTEELALKIDAFILNMERLLGAKSGSFAPIRKLFHGQDEDAEER